MVPPTESLRFVAGELGKCGRNLEEIGAKFLGPNRFGVFFFNIHVHDLGHIGKLEANLASFKTALTSAAGDGLTNIMENHTFVPRARYLRLLRRRRRYELLYHSVLCLCSKFRESRSFLWLHIKKSIRGKRSRIP